MRLVRPEVACSRAQGIWDSYGDRLPRVRFAVPDIWTAHDFCDDAGRDGEEEREAFRLVAANMGYYAGRGHHECRAILGAAIHGEAIASGGRV